MNVFLIDKDTSQVIRKVSVPQIHNLPEAPKGHKWVHADLPHGADVRDYTLDANHKPIKEKQQ